MDSNLRFWSSELICYILYKKHRVPAVDCRGGSSVSVFNGALDEGCKNTCAYGGRSQCIVSRAQEALRRAPVRSGKAHIA
ncbi:MAG: hypothetical protein NVSMB6_06800 [Burkholderiaceae bacterium]